jgi:hypothetical protein
VTAAHHEQRNRGGPSCRKHGVGGVRHHHAAARPEVRELRWRLTALTYGNNVAMSAMPAITMSATISYASEADRRSLNSARIEDLLTGQPTLAIPRSCHNA